MVTHNCFYIKNVTRMEDEFTVYLFYQSKSNINTMEKKIKQNKITGSSWLLDDFGLI